MVYSYLRFSSPQQEWGDSERRQENLANEYCAKNHLTLSNKSFADRGISAWKGANRRGALGELLNILKPGDNLLIEDNDRLSREDPLTAMNLLHSIVFKGVTVITLRDGNRIDRNNFFNLSVFLPAMVKSALANEENIKKSVRIKESWNARRKAMATGQFIGGKMPFWLKKESDGTLSVIDERVKVVKNIFEKAYNGMGFRSILHHLAKENIPTYRPKQQWSKGGVSYLLRNIAVYGAVQPYIMESKKRVKIGEPIENYYPDIISKGRFLAIQEKITKRILYHGGTQSDNVSNLFSGLCTCIQCGKNVILSNKGRQDNSYLACSQYHWHHKCTRSIINYLQVEKCFLDYVSKEALAIQHFALDDSATKYQQLIDEKKAILADLDRRIVKLTDAIEESDERVPVRSRLDERLRQKKALEAEINTLIGQLHSKSNTVSIASLVSGWVLSLRQAGLNVSVSQQLQEKIAIEQNRMFGDRYKLREALRNSVKGISIDIKAKTLYVVWNNNAKSAIEMKCKRMGQAKAVYMYRSKTNDNSYTDWVNIGSIMGSKQNTTNV